MTKFPGKVVTDLDQPKLPAYQALGANAKGKDGCGFICEQALVGTVHAIRAIHFQGHRDLVVGFTKSNFVIQGGCLLVDDEGRTIYSKMFDKTSEHWPIDELIAQLTEVGAVP